MNWGWRVCITDRIGRQFKPADFDMLLDCYQSASLSLSLHQARVNCKTALARRRRQPVAMPIAKQCGKIHLNRSRASHPTLISMTQLRDLKRFATTQQSKKRDRWLCKPCGAFLLSFKSLAFLGFMAFLPCLLN